MSMTPQSSVAACTAKEYPNMPPSSLSAKGLKAVVATRAAKVMTRPAQICDALPAQTKTSTEAMTSLRIISTISNHHMDGRYAKNRKPSLSTAIFSSLSSQSFDTSHGTSGAAMQPLYSRSPSKLINSSYTCEVESFSIFWCSFFNSLTLLEPPPSLLWLLPSSSSSSCFSTPSICRPINFLCRSFHSDILRVAKTQSTSRFLCPRLAKSVRLGCPLMCTSRSRAITVRSCCSMHAFCSSSPMLAANSPKGTVYWNKLSSLAPR
mmetsp:Transcript_16887/g.33291  ORF Transcript_16887/g.33291 Transcript_16887/m.33291 type:complete len:264 (-) Transcript_16887:125-916(-)